MTHQVTMNQNQVTRLSLSLREKFYEQAAELVNLSKQLDDALAGDLTPRHRMLLESWQFTVKEQLVQAHAAIRLFDQTAEKPVLRALG